MTSINKFHEERGGCKSVMNKHKYNNLGSLTLASKTIDLGNIS